MLLTSYKVIRGLRRAAAIAALPLALALAACGGGGSGSPTEPPPAAVTPLPASLSATVPASAEPGAAVALKTALAATNDPKSGSYPAAASPGGGRGGPMTGAIRSLM